MTIITDQQGQYSFKALPHPVPITEQHWPEGTVPLVSISCITYNHVNFIRDAIEGFLMQETTFPIEILIHDDASTDGTADIVREYEAKHPKLIRPVYQTENQYSQGDKPGFFVWPLTRGSYVAICEGDDYWTDPTKLERQVRFMGEHPQCTLSFHAAQIYDVAAQQLGRVLRRGTHSRFFTTEEVILGGGGLIPTASIVTRPSVLLDPGDFRDKFPVGDYPMVLRAATMGLVYYIDRTMSVYRVNNPRSMMGKVQQLSTKEYVWRYVLFADALMAFDQETGGEYSVAVREKANQYVYRALENARSRGTRLEFLTELYRYKGYLHAPQIIALIGAQRLRNGAVRKSKQLLGRVKSVPFARKLRLWSKQPAYTASCIRDLKPPRVVFERKGMHCFFGYYDLNPFSWDESSLLAVSTGAGLESPQPMDSMTIGYFRLNDQSRQFDVLGETNLWCWQQGCRLRWHPADANRLITYNRLVDGTYGTVIQDIETKEIVREYSFSLYDIDSLGKNGVTLNFSRLQRLRPGYGYGVLPDETREQNCPADDGVWLADLELGSKELLFSCSQIAAIEPSPSMVDAEHYINHLSISPKGTSCLFFHLWLHKETKKRYSRLFTFDFDTLDLRLLLSDGPVSHYTWVSDDILSVTMTVSERRDVRYVLCHKRTGFIGVSGVNQLREDGHQTFLSGTDLMITDTYPNSYRDQRLLLYRIGDDRLKTIDRFRIPPDFAGEVRCDLHPRVSPSQRMVCIDMVRNGHRAMAVLDISALVGKLGSDPIRSKRINAQLQCPV